MKFLFLFLLLTGQSFAHEKSFKTIADKAAFGTYSERKVHPWPFPLLSIGNIMQSFQDYVGSPYWHDGLDIRGNAGQAIHASAGGKVVNVQNYVNGNPLYWEIAILDSEGFVWKYHHVDSKTIPQAIHEAFKKKSEIPAGTHIGNIIEWPVTSFGEVYNHLHLLVVGGDGKYINPFLLLNPLDDTQAPVINKIGIVQDEYPIDETRVTGEHSLYVDTSDLILHNKFLQPPHKISYRMDKQDEVLVWEFIHLPSGNNDQDYIEDFYVKRTCGDYRCRRFYINLNFSLKNPRQTLKLSPGSHEIEVTVEDIAGNKASKNFTWQVY